MSKLTMAAAGGIGFLLGSRAGREPYEKTMARVQKLRNDPQVQRGVADAKASVADTASEAARAARTKVDEVTSDSGTGTP